MLGPRAEKSQEKCVQYMHNLANYLFLQKCESKVNLCLCYKLETIGLADTSFLYSIIENVYIIQLMH